MSDTHGWQRPDLGRPGVVPLRPLRVSEICAGAVLTMRKHAGLMLGFSVLVVAIGQGLSIALALSPLGEFVERATRNAQNALRTPVAPEQSMGMLRDNLAAFGLTAIPSVLVQTFVSGLLTVVVGKAVLGRPVALRDAWAEAKPRLPALLGLTVVYLVVVMAGLMLFVVPGVWAGVLLGLATPALVLEKGRISQAMRRSPTLVRGAWWRVFGVLALATIIGMAVATLIQLPFELAAGGAPASGTAAPDSPVRGLLSSGIAGTISGAISTPFIAAMTALLYIDQRMRREGMDVDLARAAGTAPAGW